MTVTIWSYSESASVAGEVGKAGEELAAQAGGTHASLDIGLMRKDLGCGGTRLVLTGPGETTQPEVAAEAIFRAAG